MKRAMRPLSERLVVNGECREFRIVEGPRRGLVPISNGRPWYGQIVIDGATVSTHVAALEAKLGRPLRPGMYACHTCDNPPCCNEDHLFEGTPTDNVADMVAKGRRVLANAGKTHCRRGHEFTPANTIRNGRKRACRLCVQLGDRARRRGLTIEELISA